LNIPLVTEEKLAVFSDPVTDAAIILPLLIIVWAIMSSWRRVRPTEKGLIERLGKYHKFAEGGLTLVLPFIDRLIKVNITERMTPVEPQVIITKDKVFLKVDAVIFYKIRPDENSVKASEYNVANFTAQIDTLARTVLRDIIGGMDMVDANTSRTQINERLLDQLEQLTNGWGIHITRAEIKDIVPPADLVASMEEVLKADNVRQANEKKAIAVRVLAEGEANAMVATADGQKKSQILRAEGEKQSAILVAEGEAKATELTQTALNTYFVDNAKAYKELDVTRDALMNNTKFIVPEGKSLTLIMDERRNLADTITPLQPSGNGGQPDKSGKQPMTP
jgi:regulator of protease activity HflC (stomatin/prohibitin superfamily)